MTRNIDFSVMENRYKLSVKMTLHIYCRLISFSCFASIKILSYSFSQNESGKIIVFFSQVDITWSCAYKTIIACLSHLLSHFFAYQANTSLAFMSPWFCSCCSFYQECCSLPLVLGKFPFFCKVLVSFPGGPLTPLCSHLISHKTLRLHTFQQRPTPKLEPLYFPSLLPRCSSPR